MPPDAYVGYAPDAVMPEDPKKYAREKIGKVCCDMWFGEAKISVKTLKEVLKDLSETIDKTIESKLGE